MKGAGGPLVAGQTPIRTDFDLSVFKICLTKIAVNSLALDIDQFSSQKEQDI